MKTILFTAILCAATPAYADEWTRYSNDKAAQLLSTMSLCVRFPLTCQGQGDAASQQYDNLQDINRLHDSLRDSGE